MNEGVMYPIMTDLPPAPESILKVIKCGCKGTCSTARCTCKKNGVECSPACKNCKGTSCLNVQKIVLDANHELDEFDDE